MKRFLLFVTWVWLIIIGALLITPGGIFCIVCGATIDASGFIGKNAVFVMGIVSILMGVLGLVISKRNKIG